MLKWPDNALLDARQARAPRIYEGTSEIQRLVIGGRSCAVAPSRQPVTEFSYWPYRVRRATVFAAPAEDTAVRRR